MKKYVFEYWFRRRFFEKDFERVIIIAQNLQEAEETFRNTVDSKAKFTLISEKNYRSMHYKHLNINNKN